ncbi:Alpha/Beta hydrolase protein [Limtongia smithiae]|uniref:Alpha/Beta hydrolase protein n=1 Tax=Limtongia smithiae TaxID=1125753 RepID=UPI0034CE7169
MIDSAVFRPDSVSDHDVPVDLLGFSMGGHLALDCYFRSRSDAARHPGVPRIRSLIIISSYARGLGAHERKVRVETLEVLQRHKYAFISTPRVAQFVGPGKLDDPDVGGLIRAMDRTLGKTVLVNQFRALIDRANFMPRLHEIDIPVLYIGSLGDQVVKADHIREMHASTNHSKLLLFKTHGHMLPLEAPVDLAEAVCDFVSSSRGNTV